MRKIAVSDRDFPRIGGLLRLLAAVGIGAVVWLGILPWIGRQDATRRLIETQRAAGINPSAMFYSEVYSPDAAVEVAASRPSHSE